MENTDLSCPATLFPPEREYQRARSTLHTETVWQNLWHFQMDSIKLNRLADSANFHVGKFCLIISLPALDLKVCLCSASQDFWGHVCLLYKWVDMDSSLIQVVEVDINSEKELKNKNIKNATQIGVYCRMMAKFHNVHYNIIAALYSDPFKVSSRCLCRTV